MGMGDEQVANARVQEVLDKTDKWIICPVCEGEGTTVNPDIDANGLTSLDFEDREFAADYMAGVFDISCRACGGAGKLRESKIAELEQAAADRRLAARENGDAEGYMAAHDWRYGY